MRERKMSKGKVDELCRNNGRRSSRNKGKKVKLSEVRRNRGGEVGKEKFQPGKR